MSLKLVLSLTLFGLLFFPAPVRAANPLPAAAAVGGIGARPQSLPLDCESRSAVDWAAFFGTAIDEMAFFQALPKTDNPDTGFVGNVYDAPGNLPPRGYGVYAGPVAALLRSYGLAAEARSGASETDLQTEVAAGRPVIVWYIYGFRQTNVYQMTDLVGSVFTAAPFEHTGIVVGYDPASYTVIDAFSGLAQWVDRSQFLNSWAVLGNLAVISRPADSGAAPPPPPADAGSPPASPGSAVYYTVQPGDYLIGISQRLGVNWVDLAALNNLSDPYWIYPGQQLLVPGGGAPVPAQPAAPAADDVPATYIVQPGDTLSQIAQRYGLYWPALAAANNLVWPYTLYPGQALNLPGR
jgi:LysM repeat protein/uncharacterized protein YvpB